MPARRAPCRRATEKSITGCLSRNRRETGIVAIAFSGRKAAMTSDKSPRQRSSRLVDGPGVGARWRACLAIIDGALFKDRSRWLCLLTLAPLVALQSFVERAPKDPLLLVS